MHIGRQSAAQRLSTPQAQSREVSQQKPQTWSAAERPTCEYNWRNWTLLFHALPPVGCRGFMGRLNPSIGRYAPRRTRSVRPLGTGKRPPRIEPVPMLRRPHSYQRCVVNETNTEIKSASPRRLRSHSSNTFSFPTLVLPRHQKSVAFVRSTRKGKLA